MRSFYRLLKKLANLHYGKFRCIKQCRSKVLQRKTMSTVTL
ncbi:unnamed protein product [Acanthoscelides obtectus]|nr:unnamed protein product [Acanthoscelides obtectus]CAK1631335.1 hypothetical protein AOBTE_LOCUS6891 [Acanthoscelides obtectus]